MAESFDILCDVNRADNIGERVSPPLPPVLQQLGTHLSHFLVCSGVPLTLSGIAPASSRWFRISTAHALELVDASVATSSRMDTLDAQKRFDSNFKIRLTRQATTVLLRNCITTATRRCANEVCITYTSWEHTPRETSNNP